MKGTGGVPQKRRAATLDLITMEVEVMEVEVIEVENSNNISAVT